MSQTETVTIKALEARVSGIFRKVGALAEVADCLAGVIVAGERDHCAAHGLYRIEGCLRTIKAGQVKPDVKPALMSADGAIVRIDAKMGFSNPAFHFGLPMLVEKAREYGLAALVIQDCTHFSALWHETEAIAAHGLAGLAMCPSYATVAPFGGNAPLLGTNPLAFGWPRPDKDPYVFDFATSMAARGEIELYKRSGKSLPEGWGIDKDGNASTDPAAVLEGSMLPFGSHKGSAISTMIELLAGAMIGDLTSPEALEALGTTTLAPHHGELILALDPIKFSQGRTSDPFARAEMMLEAIAGQGARLPSQRRFAARKQTLAEGITLDEKELALLARFEKEGLDGISL
ncbi:Ldh family oxidoreductase [uncultured Cohaesibacter sp.]|uniref:Ldh family oxidoreductase n=1 Tax=uncultured Cohaesibacter sp. TaxID=1002546 RepID=UPI0029C8AC05|nr:Ldh family oxidoreductase [uncultured Cohaesibacter sp.]